jgi:lysozyme
MDEWDLLAAQMSQGATGGSPALAAPTTQDSSYGIMDGLRQITRGGMKGIGGMASLLPELALSAVKAAPYALGGMGINQQTSKQISDAIPYNYGDLTSMLMGDVAKVMPASKPNDSKFLETAAEIAVPAGGLLGLGRKAAATAISQGKNVPLIARLFGGTTSPMVEAAGITGASGAAGTAAALDADPATQALAALLGGVSGTTGAGLIRAGNQATRQAITTGKDLLDKTDEVKTVLNRFGQTLPEKAQDAGEAMAVRKLKRVIDDGDISDLVRQIDEAPTSVGTLGEQLNDPRLLGFEESLTKSIPKAREQRLLADRSLSARLQQDLDALAPPAKGAESVALQEGLNVAEQQARKAAGELFNQIDPNKTSSIPISKVKNNLWDKGYDTHLDSLRSLKGDDAKLINSFIKEKQSIPFEKLQKYNSLAGKQVEEAIAAGRYRDASVLRTFRSSLVEAVDKAAASGKRNISPEDATRWRQAKAAWADYEDTFNAGLTKKLRESEAPSTFGKQLLQQPDEEIKRIVKALPTEQIPSARRLVVDEILEGSRKPGTEILSPTKLSEKLRTASKKTSGLFDSDHRKALDEISSIVSSRVEARETGKAFAPRFEDGKIKSMFEHTKDMFSSRLGWKYPIRRKVIQFATQNNKIQQASIEDLMNQALVEMIHDPQYAKALITKHTADGAKSFVNKGTGKLILERGTEKVKELLQGAVKIGGAATTSYAESGVRRGIPAAGLFAAETGSAMQDLGSLFKEEGAKDEWDLLAESFSNPSLGGGSDAPTTNSDDFFLDEPQAGFERTSFIPEEMPEMTLTSDSGIDFIKKHEGLRLTTYKDTAGHDTIGYGRTKNIPKTGKITKEEAEQMLIEDIEAHEQEVRNAVKVPLTQEQFDALSSFTFNVGGPALRRSALLKKLNAGDYEGAADEFVKWNKERIKGKLQPNRGLTKRRQAERELFLSGIGKDLITV